MFNKKRLYKTAKLLDKDLKRIYQPKDTRTNIIFLSNGNFTINVQLNFTFNNNTLTACLKSEST